MALIKGTPGTTVFLSVLREHGACPPHKNPEGDRDSGGVASTEFLDRRGRPISHVTRDSGSNVRTSSRRDSNFSSSEESSVLL
jgi:hypothetical protein